MNIYDLIVDEFEPDDFHVVLEDEGGNKRLWTLRPLGFDYNSADDIRNSIIELWELLEASNKLT